MPPSRWQLLRAESSSADFGRMLLPVDAGIIAVGSEGVNGATATVVLIGAEAGPASADVVFAEQTIAASGSTDDGRLRVASIGTADGLLEIAASRADRRRSLCRRGQHGATLAALRDSAGDEAGFVDVRLNGGVQPVVALKLELKGCRSPSTPLATSLLASGVRSQAATGEVQFFRRSWAMPGLSTLASTASVAARWSPRRRCPASSRAAERLLHPAERLEFHRPRRRRSIANPIPSGRSRPPARRATAPWSRLACPARTMIVSPSWRRRSRRRRQHAVVDLRHAPDDPGPDPGGRPTEAWLRPPPSAPGPRSPSSRGAWLLPTRAEIDGVRDEGAIFVFEATVGPAGCTITGTDGDDTLNGTTDDDVICGLGGNDLIRGNLGFDRIYGGPGDDDLSGDAADDLLVGGAGNDRLAGGAGADALYGGDGNDRLYGGAGNDHLDGGDGRDPCYGGADIDTFNAC
ncbi:MAG: calcium-binding protein [Acidimicrobiales bacterium]